MNKGFKLLGRDAFWALTPFTIIASTLTVFFQPLTAQAQTLGQAVNAPELTWTTSGSGASGWSVQNIKTHDGVSAAQSGLVSGSFQTSTLQTTVTGPGRLSFWWNDDSAVNLQFTVNGFLQTNIYQWGNWRKEIIYVSAGNQVLRWIATNGSGTSRGFLDEVTFEPGSFSPEIFVQPLSQSQVAGLDTMFAVAAHGTVPLAYQWQFNGSDILNATNRTLIVSNAQASVLGDYRVIVSNAVGTVTSSVAVLELGQVAAWGQIDDYGWATATNGLTNIIGIAGGAIHNLALRADGTVVGWGYNNLGGISVPPDVTNGIGVTAGINSSGSLQSDGKLRSWGAAGFGVTAITNVPIDLTNVVRLAFGDSHATALKTDGTVIAWGQNFSGATNVPAGLSNVVAVSAKLHNLALRSDGSVVSWGVNNVGQANVPAQAANIVAVSAGRFHSVALKADGTVIAWGNNSFGQTNVPPGLTNVVAIAAGWDFTLALKADGTVVAWGYNQYGQTNVPANLTNVIAISAGASQALALVGDGPPIVSAPATDTSLSENGFSVKIPSQSGRVYRLEYKTSLADQEWTPLPLVAGTGKDLVLTDAGVGTQRFYRVQRW